jgi:hypothetical protein
VVVSKTLTPVFGAGPVSKPLVSAEAYSNFRMVLEYDAAVPSRVALGKDASVELPAGSGRRVELAYEHIPSSAPHVRVWINGKADGEGRAIGKGRQQEAIEVADLESSRQVLRFDRDFKAMVMFRPGKRGGTLFAKAMPEGKWIPNAKALYLRNNRLIYDIAFVGALTGESVVAQAIFSMSGERSFQGRTVAFSRCWRVVPPWMSQGVIVCRVSLARQ